MRRGETIHEEEEDGIQDSVRGGAQTDRRKAKGKESQRRNGPETRMLNGHRSRTESLSGPQNVNLANLQDSDEWARLAGAGRTSLGLVRSRGEEDRSPA